MFGEQYTRWNTSDNEETQDGRPEEYEDGLEERRDGYESMQEGRRILAMPTVMKSSTTALSTPAMGRLICTSILIFVLCISLSALAGYMAGLHKSLGASVVTLSSNQTIPLNMPNIPSSSAPASKSVDEIHLNSYQNIMGINNLVALLQSHLTVDLIKKYVQNITSTEPLKLKYYIQTTFETLGLKVEPRTFPVMMSLPNTSFSNTVEIVMANNESQIVNNKTSSLEDLFPFSGFSLNGTTFGSIVYAHFGRLEDFEILKKKGIDPLGSILLIRAGKIHPGIQVRNAEKFGATGVIIYPDPADFQEYGATDIYYPDSGSLPQDGVIWQNLRFIPGDPSTPNSASQKDAYRIPIKNYTGVPSIIVQPVSSDTGKLLLAQLSGEEAPKDWNGALMEKYFLGKQLKNNVKGVRIKSYNFIAEESSTDIFAYLPSKDASKAIHIGCRYETKGSLLTSSALGLATVLALADSFMKAFPNGTQRQVVFNIFEAMEDDFSGGTEFSQLYSSWLESTALAYIDSDTILKGSGFLEAHVSPILRDTVRNALHHVAWPEGEALNILEGLVKAIPIESVLKNYGDINSTLQDSFHFSNPFECDEMLNFASMHGIATVQLVSVNINKTVSYTLRNSQYDTAYALIMLEDKDFKWTHMMASLIGVTTLFLSSTLLPPIRFDEVASDISTAWDNFINEESIKFNVSSHKEIHDLLYRISPEVEMFALTCESLDTWYKDGSEKMEGMIAGEQFRLLEDRIMKIIEISRAFLRPRTARQLSGFGSVLDYGPRSDNPCEGTHFPFVRKALNDIVNGNSNNDVLEEELTYIYSALSAFNTHMLNL